MNQLHAREVFRPDELVVDLSWTSQDFNRKASPQTLAIIIHGVGDVLRQIARGCKPVDFTNEAMVIHTLGELAAKVHPKNVECIISSFALGLFNNVQLKEQQYKHEATHGPLHPLAWSQFDADMHMMDDDDPSGYVVDPDTKKVTIKTTFHEDEITTVNYIAFDKFADFGKTPEDMVGFDHHQPRDHMPLETKEERKEKNVLHQLWSMLLDLKAKKGDLRDVFDPEKMILYTLGDDNTLMRSSAHHIVKGAVLPTRPVQPVVLPTLR